MARKFEISTSYQFRGLLSPQVLYIKPPYGEHYFGAVWSDPDGIYEKGYGISIEETHRYGGTVWIEVSPLEGYEVIALGEGKFLNRDVVVLPVEGRRYIIPLAPEWDNKIIKENTLGDRLEYSLVVFDPVKGIKDIETENFEVYVSNPDGNWRKFLFPRVAGIKRIAYAILNNKLGVSLTHSGWKYSQRFGNAHAYRVGNFVLITEDILNPEVKCFWVPLIDGEKLPSWEEIIYFASRELKLSDAELSEMFGCHIVARSHVVFLMKKGISAVLYGDGTRFLTDFHVETPLYNYTWENTIFERKLMKELLSGLKNKLQRSSLWSKAEVLKRLPRETILSLVSKVEEFCLSDSTEAGNCSPGTITWANRLGIDVDAHECIKGSELAKKLAQHPELISGDFLRVLALKVSWDQIRKINLQDKEVEEVVEEV